MPSWAKATVDAWKSVAHLEEGFVFRRVNKGDNLMGESITPQAIRDIVNSYAEKLENQGIAPHDLRRTFAKLAHKGGSSIDQIQLSLGHDSIQTTEKYLLIYNLTEINLRSGNILLHMPDDGLLFLNNGTHHIANRNNAG